MGRIVSLKELETVYGPNTGYHQMIDKRVAIIFLNDGKSLVLRYLGPYNLYDTVSVMQKGEFEVEEGNEELNQLVRLLYEQI